jgi:hypothetical protein
MLEGCMSEFDDIRPYNDEEVRPCIDRLIADSEFIDAIARLRFPTIGRLLPGAMRGMVRNRVIRETAHVNSVRDFQDIIESYFSPLIDRTVDTLSVSGLDGLPRDKAALFISNHRDIAMDPAFVNWVLYHNGFSTVRIAIGDNLLTKPFASDLMRLNKSFIVNRSATAPREKLKAAKHLSHYIHHSVLQDNENVWIAQREGRAKDGRDKTNPAIISMIALSRDKSQNFADFIREANIIPVSISYEYDPCDQAKAREVFEKAKTGEYKKAEHEDVISIAKGIAGYKGNVHLSFGMPLRGNFETAEDVTAEVDSQILRNYVLHPSNCLAYEMLEKSSPKVLVGEQATVFTDDDWNAQRERFREHISNCNSRYLDTLLRGYANPVYTRLKLNADVGS